MIFFEKLRTFDVVRLACTQETAFHGGQSLGARFAQRLLAPLGRNIRAEKIDFGHVGAATGIRSNAYRAAEAELEWLPGRAWAESLSPVLGLDFWLTARKFFFDEFYLRFEFLEFALRYAEEYPEEAHSLRVVGGLPTKYRELLTCRFKMRRSAGSSPIGLLSLALLPLFVEFFWWRKGTRGVLRLDGRIVCQVDCAKTLEMFSSLFASLPRERIVFVAEQRNAAAFEPGTVHVLCLRDDEAGYLRRVAWPYLWRSLKHLREIGCHGNALFRLFYVLMQGRAETIGGTGNLYCTYEHLITPKWIRNAYLKAGGNQSVFVPMNTYITPLYFHSEIFLNYDVMCAAGRHIEALYRQKHALTDVYLPTGSYDSHRGIVEQRGKAARLGRLREFQGDRMLVTIVSPGICDPTYGHELKLMALARTLSQLPGVCVLVRLKPVPPQPKYANFYEEQTAGCQNLLLTAGEYELFDFLELDCLFVTSISNAAYDLAQAGAQVMFIDYLKDPELIPCWSEVPGVLLNEYEALAKVTDWLHDRNEARHRWAELMARFSAYIGYRHADFESYRSDLLAQLRPYAPRLLGCEPVADAA
jgi:hypothetical protein